MNRSFYKTSIRFFAQEPVLLAVYGLITVLASLQQYTLPPQLSDDGAIHYTQYNNYVIFKNSFVHLLAGQNLYDFYATEQRDLFKYSPTFALFMGLLAFLPNWLGLILWNLLNTLVLFAGFKQLPGLDRDRTVKMRWFVLIELLTAIQNSQSNGLLLGLFLWSFIYLERGKPLRATLFMILGGFIKIFGVVGFVLFLLYPRKPAALAYTLLWTVVLVALPLVVVPYEQLVQQYQNWLVLLQTDHSGSIGLSVMGWLHTWFALDPPKLVVVLIGGVGLLLPLLRTAQYDVYPYRLLMLASVLIWVVIFNHKAESPTFIIAIGGVAIWYFSQPHTVTNRVLLVLAFLFTSLSPTDVFPALIRDLIVIPYVLKVVFCIAVWVKITVDLLNPSFKQRLSRTSNAF